MFRALGRSGPGSSPMPLGSGGARMVPRPVDGCVPRTFTEPLESGMLTIDHAVERLRERVLGGVVTPGDASWDDARRAWNLALDQRPELVVQAESAEDVAAVVRFAREQ